MGTTYIISFIFQKHSNVCFWGDYSKPFWKKDTALKSRTSTHLIDISFFCYFAGMSTHFDGDDDENRNSSKTSNKFWQCGDSHRKIAGQNVKIVFKMFFRMWQKVKTLILKICFNVLAFNELSNDNLILMMWILHNSFLCPT